MKTSFKVLISILVLLISAASSDARISQDRLSYIQKYKEIAIRQMNSSGIPASIILAQGCLESGNGKSRLAVKANNHFGIKCHNWNGATYRYDDDRKNECFRKYRNAEESFRDHSEFLMEGKRYAFLFAYGKEDYKAWAHGLKKAGYATNPKYAQLLIGIIEEYGLDRYDRGDTDTEITEIDRETECETPVPDSPAGMTVICSDNVAQKEYVDVHPLYRYTTERNVYLNNGRAFIIAQKGDTWKSIAEMYNLFRSQVLRYNDLKKEREIHEGEIIYLEHKKNRSFRKFKTHKVGEGETLYSISQKYAVKMKQLMKRNDITDAEHIAKGRILKLR